MKYLITGGSGFIGTNLIDRLQQDGHNVTVFGRNKPKREVAWITGDLGSEGVKEAIREVKPQVIVHLGSIVHVGYAKEHPDETLEVNVQGTQRLLDAAKEAGVGKVVYASSIKVYGEKLQGWVDETAAPNPGSVYAHSKRSAEERCLQAARAGLDVAILRLTNTYGPEQCYVEGKAAVVPTMINKARTGQVPTITPGARADFVYVGDVVDAFVKSTHKNTSTDPVFNVCSGTQTELGDVARAVWDAAGKTLEVPRVETVPPAGGYVIERARATLGWEPRVSVKDGIRMTYDWTQTQPL